MNALLLYAWIALGLSIFLAFIGLVVVMVHEIREYRKFKESTRQNQIGVLERFDAIPFDGGLHPDAVSGADFPEYWDFGDWSTDLNERYLHSKPHGVCHSDITARGFCRCCGKVAYDCECPTLRCSKCSLNPEDAAYIDPTKCDYSADRKHDWKREERA